MWRKQGVVQGIVFSLGFMIIIFTLLITFGEAMRALSTMLIIFCLIGAFSLLGWFVVDKTC
ncbi:hypothetical protein JXB28_04835 [Candidatus Woesearchaeota archaeon]|nr:hypothetical protein [Candidatus Woesearchaeota archaeon]